MPTQPYSKLDQERAFLMPAVAVTEAAHERSHAPLIDALRARLSPIKPRLEKRLAQIPDEVKAAGMHMTELAPLVLGRQRQKPTNWEVAKALSELGWVKRRCYRENQPSITIWLPPTVPQEPK